MPNRVDLSLLAEVSGVTGYILVDAEGHLLRQMNEPATRSLASALVEWGRQCAKVGKGFRYLAFARKNGEHLAVYRVGSDYLGVILTNHHGAEESIEKIFGIINRLSSGEGRHSVANGQTKRRPPHEH